MTSSEILVRAAGIVRQRGHCQGRMEDEQGRCCGLQAMIYAAGGERTPEVDEAYQMWCRQTGYAVVAGNCPEGYNNTHTAEEVVSSLLAAASIDVKRERVLSEFL